MNNSVEKWFWPSAADAVDAIATSGGVR